LVTPYDHNFIESYAVKEVRRFSNLLLCDPITRVAREPIRKLHPSGRLMGALRLLLSTGVRPTYLVAGIVAALQYSDTSDRDHLQLKNIQCFGVQPFLKYHLGLDSSSLESQYIVKCHDDVLKFLHRELICD
jgi:mannitol-1-phosphate/altronate dehydrogenase